jgi:hypothetical protein
LLCSSSNNRSDIARSHRAAALGLEYKWRLGSFLERPQLAQLVSGDRLNALSACNCLINARVSSSLSLVVIGVFL